MTGSHQQNCHYFLLRSPPSVFTRMPPDDARYTIILLVRIHSVFTPQRDALKKCEGRPEWAAFTFYCAYVLKRTVWTADMAFGCFLIRQQRDKLHRIQIAHDIGARIHVAKHEIIDSDFGEHTRLIGVLVGADDEFRPHVFAYVACKIIWNITSL